MDKDDSDFGPGRARGKRGFVGGKEKKNRLFSSSFLPTIPFPFIFYPPILLNHSPSTFKVQLSFSPRKNLPQSGIIPWQSKKVSYVYPKSTLKPETLLSRAGFWKTAILYHQMSIIKNYRILCLALVSGENVICDYVITICLHPGNAGKIGLPKPHGLGVAQVQEGVLR